MLTEFYIERRHFIDHRSIPEHVKNSFIAVEDKRFHKHFGVDLIRIAGALIANIKNRSFVEGGSTITQQIAKMLFLTPEKTITRKIKEIALSVLLERKYNKQEILGIYLNHIYLGSRAYGIEAAAQTYFCKSTNSITISEAALLAALPKAPSRHSPFKHSKKAVRRRNLVLNKMRSMGFINEVQYSHAIESPLPEKLHGRRYKAPYFVDYMRTVLENKFGDRLYTSGLTIYSTLDYRIQKAAEAAVAGGINKLKQRGVEGVQAALIAIELKTGRILAMVGGTDYAATQFNRAVQAKRQPGSAFKPVVYLSALNHGFSPDSIVDDKKIAYLRKEGIWVPQNYNHVYHGKVSLRTAFAQSLNAATVNLARKIGISSIIKTAKQLGIQSTIHPYTSSALGASETTLLEMVCSYAALSHGFRIAPVVIDRTIDRQQMSLMEPSALRQRVIDKTVLHSIKSMLRSVVLEGTGRKASVLTRKAYGKTGTTNDHTDTWFFGFDEDIAAGVWVGRDNHKTIGNNETGASAALPIWIEFMKNSENSDRPEKNRMLAKRTH